MLLLCRLLLAERFLYFFVTLLRLVLPLLHQHLVLLVQDGVVTENVFHLTLPVCVGVDARLSGRSVLQRRIWEENSKRQEADLENVTLKPQTPKAADTQGHLV